MSALHVTRATSQHITISKSTDSAAVPVVVAPVVASSSSAAAAISPAAAANTEHALHTPPPVATRYRGGGKIGRKNWQPRHLDRMLSLVLECMPAGTDAWDRCAKLYNEGMETEHARTGIQLKEKFTQLMRNKGQTGNPEISQYTERALAIQEQIETRLSITQSDDPFTSSIDDISPDILTQDETLHDDYSMQLPPPPALPVAAAAASSSASSQSSPQLLFSPERIGIKRKRAQTDTLIKEALDRDREQNSVMREALRLVAESVASLAQANQAAELRHEERALRHEQLMAMILSRKE